MTVDLVSKLKCKAEITKYTTQAKRGRLGYTMAGIPCIQIEDNYFIQCTSDLVDCIDMQERSIGEFNFLETENQLRKVFAERFKNFPSFNRQAQSNVITKRMSAFQYINNDTRQSLNISNSFKG